MLVGLRLIISGPGKNFIQCVLPLPGGFGLCLFTSLVTGFRLRHSLSVKPLALVVGFIVLEVVKGVR